MKKKFILILLTTLFAGFNRVRSQANNDSRYELGLHGAFEISTPAWGAGANGRILFPLSNGNKITAGIYFDRVKVKYEYTGNVYKYSYLAVQAGYRKMIQSFFIEPILGGGYSSERHPWRTTRGLFFSGGIMGGVYLNKLTLSSGIRFLGDGIIFGDSYIIVNAGLAIRLGN